VSIYIIQDATLVESIVDLSHIMSFPFTGKRRIKERKRKKVIEEERDEID
jgi:hypothetical protein